MWKQEEAAFVYTRSLKAERLQRSAVQLWQKPTMLHFQSQLHIVYAPIGLAKLLSEDAGPILVRLSRTYNQTRKREAK